MLRNRSMILLGLLVIASMILTACGGGTTPTTQPDATQAPVVTEAPVATEAPTTRHGGWLDEIDVSVVASESAISQIQAGAIDLYSYGLASDSYPAIKEAGLPYSQSMGGSYAIMFNPAVFTSGVLNPFSNRKIREAVNWLIDRNYINQEIYAGGSLPKLFAITTQMVEYTHYIETTRALESKYAYNLEKAKQVISDEMTGMGAKLGADGKWEIDGKPVVVAFVIRTDGDGTRKPLGDYTSNQLESVGFTVDRQYKTSSEASPIVWNSVASDGLWQVYTAGWLPAGLTRDEAAQFQQMYLDSSIQAGEPFISNVSDPEFKKLGDDLAQAVFTTPEQRDEMMRKALELSLQDSLQVWVIDQISYSPYNDKVQVTSDLAAGVESAYVGGNNIRFIGQEGGTMKVGTADLFSDPWNPIAGGNWVWDSAIQRMTSMSSDIAPGGGGVIGDPYTGLAWPNRIESAELTVKAGLPITKSLDWFTMNTVDQIDVPADAWTDWDAKTQKFITVGEKYPNGATAKVKSVVTYPADLYETVKWHDGSPISVADFIMPMIEYYDRGKPESPIYDESYTPVLEAQMAVVSATRIVSTNPLVIESYSENYISSAELNIQPYWPVSISGLAGDHSWPMLAISNLADGSGELAYSAEKADAAQVDQMSWVGGPSLEILAKYLDQAAGEAYIPYEPTLGQYITADEAKLRYANTQKWYADHGHFIIGTGPYYLDKAFMTEKSLVLKNFADYPDLSNKWDFLGVPKLASVQLDGPAQVKAGEEATFDAMVTFKDAPYVQADIKQVKYILYDATNTVVEIGDATFVAEGQYQIVLSSGTTTKLPTGSVKLEVAIVPIPVAIPAFTALDFVVIP